MKLIKTYSEYLQRINEGLLKTYDGEKSINTMLSKIPFSIKSSGWYKNGEVTLIIDEYKHIQNNIIGLLLDSITSIMTNAYGWFPSIMIVDTDMGVNELQYDENFLRMRKGVINRIEIKFYSKFDEIEENIPDKIYHLSIMEYDKKIRKYGLSPKSKSKLDYHPDRIYLCKNIEDCRNLINSMKMYYSEERDINIHNLRNSKYKKNSNWIIYEISYDEMLKDDKSLILYKDPKYVNKGFYTLENIPPKYLNEKEREE